jgi:hypothetical protein
MFKASDFNFDIEKCGRVVAGEDVVEIGQIGKIARTGLGDLNFTECRVMADEGAAIGSAAHVELEAVATMRESKVERRESVFGNGAGGAGTAMTEQEGTGH